ncbi:hypothetical protein VARIO8X_60481 [Burkholderiales bacterium 8X]|nr:hypothetical protein VARIO8X_60481 [Burkholderiales bacterium 8X]
MTVFSIDSTLFETLSDTANVNAEQLKSFVAQANSNVLLNSLLSIADARGDLIIRVANSEELRNPSYVEAGAWFDPYKKADDGKFELLLRPDKFIGPNAKFSRFKPEHGQVDGREVRVYGYPKRNELDYLQGDAVADYLGTCALTSIANLRTQSGRVTTESEVVRLAIANDWAVNDPSLPAAQLGGSTVSDQQAILDSYGIRNGVVAGYNEAGLANLLRSGRGVIVAVNAGALWDDAEYVQGGGVNHAVTLTGAVYGAGNDGEAGELVGFYLADSGRGRVGDMTRFVDIESFRRAARVPDAYAIYSIEPLKQWDEDIDGTGNAEANVLVGNRGDNVLAGLEGDDLIEGDAGNDTLVGGSGNDRLIGGAGDDVYVFGAGFGDDRIGQGGGGAIEGLDVIRFQDDITADRLWFGRSENDLEVRVFGSDDRLRIDDWFLPPGEGAEGSAGGITRFESSDGQALLARQVSCLIEAMASFDPPAPGYTERPAGYQAALAPMLAANWQSSLG